VDLRVSLRLLSVAALVLLLAAASQADTWGRTFWTDDFEDGDYTSDPTWLTFASPGGSRGVVTWEADYAFELNAPYVLAYGAGWSGAYVDVSQGDQGIVTWLDTSPLASDDWAAISMLRYSAPSVAFGTGYALAVTNTAGSALVAQLFQLDDLSYGAVTDPTVVAGSYQDVWVRFLATGTGTNTRLLGRVWADGQAEPAGWTLDSGQPGSEAGITNYYDTGRGGLGVVATGGEVTADAYFDDVEYGIPEPGTLALLAAGLGALAIRRRRRS
jgi:hypothetical protein